MLHASLPTVPLLYWQHIAIFRKKIRQTTKGIPALILTPEEETVDRALAKDISRDLSLMMLAASIAKTAIASLQVEFLSKEKVCELGHKTYVVTW